MKILSDECVYKITIKFLKELNYDIITVKEIGLAGSSDDELIEYANSNNMVLLTNDKDFGNILRFYYENYSGIIRLKISSKTVLEVHNKLKDFLDKWKDKELKGKLIIIDKNKYRIRE